MINPSDFLKWKLVFGLGSGGGGAVDSILGTANQISVSNPTGNVTLSIFSNPVLPGTAGVTLPQGTTAQQAGNAGTIRLNTQTNVFEGTVDGSTWAAFETGSTGVLSVGGTANRITSSGGTTPVIDIDAAYVGQASLTTLGIVTSGTWNADTIAVENGGTGLTTTTENELLYSSATDTITGLGTLANGVLITDNSEVPAFLANSSTPGYVLTANSGAPPSWQATGATGIAWVDASSTPITAAINTGYYVTNATTVTITLPVTCPAGSVVSIVGFGSGGWILRPGGGQTIQILDATATTSIASAETYDCISVLCVISGTTWVAFSSTTTAFDIN